MQRFSSMIWRRTGLDRHISDTQTWQQPLKKRPATAIVLFLFILSAAVFISASCINPSSFLVTNVTEKAIIIPQENRRSAKRVEYPLSCSAGNLTQACPVNYPTSFETEDRDRSLNSTCPDYFRWIHEDLRPFKSTGITIDKVERAKRTAHFRVVIIKGRVYVEKYKKSIQRRYPGWLPDLEMMFDCDDRPVIRSRDYSGPNATAPPPLFRYCGDRWNLDIVFPDWSFWGWAEINIKPWNIILKELKEGNGRQKWMERGPYANWKGNPLVAETRKDLLKCTISGKQDWNARQFVQDWILESQQGHKQSDLASQRTYRYKIYIEGWAWSVSEKYILACDSVTLLVKPHYYDFFMRSLQPVHHYRPIRDDDKYISIKFAVDWGNNHKQKAQAIGKAAGDFIQEELKMEYVYNYMFHLLNEYAKLLKLEAKVPEGAVEFCSESMSCRWEREEVHDGISGEGFFHHKSMHHAPSL